VVSRLEKSALMFCLSASESTTAVTYQPMQNLAWMKSGLSHKDSATCENGCGCAPDEGLDEPSLVCGPPGPPSPKDQGLGGITSGVSVSSDLWEMFMVSWLGVPWNEEVRVPSVPVEPCSLLGLGGFRDSGADFSA
jgi:hypothetical protein